MMQIHIRLAPGATMPTKAHSTDAGWDLYARNIARVNMDPQEWLISPGESAAITTGVHLGIPTGYFGLIKERSGMAFRSGLVVQAGVIDSGYQGDVIVLLMNTGYEAVLIGCGEKIAQLLILPVPAVEWVQVDALGTSERGVNGFGSSGA